MAANTETRREAMESLISLEYPNGRTHECSIPTVAKLIPGDEFDLFGRHWEATMVLRTGRMGDFEYRMSCRSVARAATANGPLV